MIIDRVLLIIDRIASSILTELKYFALLSYANFNIYHEDFSEALVDKARWKLHKDAPCCFVRILEAAANKIDAVWPLAANLTNHSQVRQTRHAEYCSGSREEVANDVFLWTPTHGHISVGWPAKTFISFLRTLDTVKKTYLERWQREREREREREKEREKRWFDANDVYIYIYIYICIYAIGIMMKVYPNGSGDQLPSRLGL